MTFGGSLAHEEQARYPARHGSLFLLPLSRGGSLHAQRRSHLPNLRRVVQGADPADARGPRGRCGSDRIRAHVRVTQGPLPRRPRPDRSERPPCARRGVRRRTRARPLPRVLLRVRRRRALAQLGVTAASGGDSLPSADEPSRARCAVACVAPCCDDRTSRRSGSFRTYSPRVAAWTRSSCRLSVTRRLRASAEQRENDAPMLVERRLLGARAPSTLGPECATRRVSLSAGALS